MAKFSMKSGGKEVGHAAVYAPPHDMKGNEIHEAQMANGYAPEPNPVSGMKVSVGNISKGNYDPKAKNDGIDIRGCGAATKGIKARGPMA